MNRQEFYALQQALIEEGTKLRKRAEVWERMRHERVLKAYQAAGLGNGKQYDGCVFHNAYVSAKSGQPWRGVDTKMLKRARYLDDTRWQAHHLVDAYMQRKWNELWKLLDELE